MIRWRGGGEGWERVGVKELRSRLLATGRQMGCFIKGRKLWAGWR